MSGRTLDTEAIRQWHDSGWTNKQIAERFHVSIDSIYRSLGHGLGATEKLALRKRWEARLPAMKAAIREAVLCENA